MRNLSKISPDWWDYTTLDRDILDAAAKLGFGTVLVAPGNEFSDLIAQYKS